MPDWKHMCTLVLTDWTPAGTLLGPLDPPARRVCTFAVCTFAPSYEVRTYVRTCVRTHVYTHCVYVCTRVRVRVHVRVHTCTHTRVYCTVRNPAIFTWIECPMSAVRRLYAQKHQKGQQSPTLSRRWIISLWFPFKALLFIFSKDCDCNHKNKYEYDIVNINVPRYKLINIIIHKEKKKQQKYIYYRKIESDW